MSLVDPQPEPAIPTHLTSFQRDLLVAAARQGPTERARELSDYLESHGYEGRITNGQLYPNLDELVDLGLVEKSAYNRRSHSYRITDDGRRVLRRYREFLGGDCR